MPQELRNVYLFTGEDDFSIQRKIQTWKTEFTKKYSTEAMSLIDATIIDEAQVLDQLKEVLAPSLFASKKLIVVKDALPGSEKFNAFIFATILDLPKDYFLVFWQTKKLDKRLSFAKEFLKHLNVSEFTLPHGPALNAWIKAEAKFLGAEIDDKAVDKLAAYLGRDLFEEKKFGGRVVERKEVFNLWQAHNELAKLSSLTGNITTTEVEMLSRPKLNENVFILSDAIVRKDVRQALKTLEDLLSLSFLDEKSSIIKLIGLLAEQVRSELAVSTLQQQNLSQIQIAERMGWSAGRVFVVSQHVNLNDSSKLENFLKNLLEIDVKLKSSDANPKLLLDLFITKACV